MVLRVDIVRRLSLVRQLRAVFRLTMSVTGGALVLKFSGVGWNCVLRQPVLSITLLLNRYGCSRLSVVRWLNSMLRLLGLQSPRSENMQKL